MGGIIGGVVGGIGSLVGGITGSQQALAGYNFLKHSQIAKTYLPEGGDAESDINSLLTGGPNSAAAKSAYNNYLNSTGYNFQLSQGTGAITGSAATRGILNSGSTAKAVNQYGQNLASTTFDNYLGQLGNVANRGLQAGQMIGAAGSAGGPAAGNILQSGLSSAGGQFGSVASNYFGGI